MLAGAAGTASAAGPPRDDAQGPRRPARASGPAARSGRSGVGPGPGVRGRRRPRGRRRAPGPASRPRLRKSWAPEPGRGARQHVASEPGPLGGGGAEERGLLGVAPAPHARSWRSRGLARPCARHAGRAGRGAGGAGGGGGSLPRAEERRVGARRSEPGESESARPPLPPHAVSAPRRPPAGGTQVGTELPLPSPLVHLPCSARLF